jgi:hypothetical protein
VERVSYLISGPVVFGGIGWALGHWLGTAFVPVGTLTWMAVSLYLVWFRYGTHQWRPLVALELSGPCPGMNRASLA